MHPALDRMREIAPDQSDDWRGLGVAILHRLVFEDLLGVHEKELPNQLMFTGRRSCGRDWKDV